ncbi:hypothetical protein [Streptomyces fractus]|uniref:hypothetical protein n=1 Tax=Streptomyces fractus TaxID=641806 RepID=UPI003CE6AC01
MGAELTKIPISLSAKDGNLAVLAATTGPGAGGGATDSALPLSARIVAVAVCALISFAVALIAGILAFAMAEAPTPGMPTEDARRVRGKRVAHTLKVAGASFGVSLVVCLTAAKALGFVL